MHNYLVGIFVSFGSNTITHCNTSRGRFSSMVNFNSEFNSVKPRILFFLHLHDVHGTIQLDKKQLKSL